MTLISRSNMFDLDRFFNDSRPQRVESGSDAFFTPRVDIKEAENHYEITAELPGVDKEDIQGILAPGQRDMHKIPGLRNRRNEW